MQRKVTTPKPSSAKPTGADELRVPIPPALGRLFKLPTADVLTQLLGLRENEKEWLGGLLSGLGIDVGVAVPDWAKNASRNFFELIGFNLEPQCEADLPGNLGLIVGMASRQPPDMPQEHASIVNSMSEFLLNIAATHATEQEAIRFNNARPEAEQTVELLKQPHRRMKAFLYIAVGWQTVASFESAGELHRWLGKLGAVEEFGDPASTRNICREIGLRIRDGKPGRPRRTKK